MTTLKLYVTFVTGVIIGVVISFTEFSGNKVSTLSAYKCRERLDGVSMNSVNASSVSGIGDKASTIIVYTCNNTSSRQRYITTDTHATIKETVTDETKILFPYNDYNRFGMEWIGVVNELDWEYSNREHNVNVSHSEKYLDIGNGSLGLTSVNQTRVMLNKNIKKFDKGQIIHIIVETYDENGRKRDRGGDTFRATMINRQLSASTAGRVADHGNGTYSIFFYGAWPGIAEIAISIDFTREAIDFLKNAIKTKEMNFPITAIYANGSQSGETQCSITNEGVWPNKCEYGNKNSLGKTSLICNKLRQFSCEDLKNMTVHVKDLDQVAKDATRRVLHMFQSPYHNTFLKDMPMKISNSDSAIQPPRPPPCGPDMPIPITDGYWKNREKRSFHLFVEVSNGRNLKP